MRGIISMDAIARRLEDPQVSFSGDAKRVHVNVGAGYLPIDILSLESAISWIMRPTRDSWEIMVTPNLHHFRLSRDSSRILKLYSQASVLVPDGWPVAWLVSRNSGQRVERVPGSDIFQRLCERPASGVKLALVGGVAGLELDGLIKRLRSTGWVVTSEPAPRIELADPEARASLVQRIAGAGTGGIVVLGVGTPRQEELAEEIAACAGSGAILCLGMSINFGSGATRRAPRYLQILGLEWAFRLAQEPHRLARRYFEDALALLQLVRQNAQRNASRPAGHKELSDGAPREQCDPRNRGRNNRPSDNEHDATDPSAVQHKWTDTETSRQK